MCGACCKGSVELTPKEFEKIRELSRKLGVRVPIELRDYVYTSKIIMKPVEDSEGEKWCVFLKKEDNRAICQIYDDRPSFCRLYPLYIGYSREQDTIYVDIVHCPNMSHNDPNDRDLISQDYIERQVKDVVDRDEYLLNIVPALDRDSVIVDLGDSIILTKLYKKFELIQKINNIILEKLSSTNLKLREVLEVLFRVQSCIKDSTIESSVKDLSTIEDIENVIRGGIEKMFEKYKFTDSEFSHMINLMMTDMGVYVDESLMVIHDMVSMKTRLFKVDYHTLFNTGIGEILPIIDEYLRQRFPIFHQIYYLPLEVFYSHGIVPIIVILSTYYICLRRIHNVDEIAACVDMGGLPYVFKYVGTFVKLTYSSYSQDSWRRVIEV